MYSRQRRREFCLGQGIDIQQEFGGSIQSSSCVPSSLG